MQTPHLPSDETSGLSPDVSPPDQRPRRRFTARHGVALPVVLVLITYLGFEASVLWREWEALRGEWREDARARVVGYPEVTPRFSFAIPPKDWYRDEGDQSRLWAGWSTVENQHQWFRFARGQLDPSRLSHAIGRDTVRPIDLPRVETGEGEIWSQIPEDDKVAATQIRGVSLAYPFAVLGKVLIVNDSVLGCPLLVVFSPFEKGDHCASVYSPVLDTDRLTMGHTGYLCDGEPLLYDRKSESLWMGTQKGLKAVAGPLCGKTLPRLTRMSTVEWGTWRTDHPDTRLVVGSNRAIAKR